MIDRARGRRSWSVPHRGTVLALLCAALTGLFIWSWYLRAEIEWLEAGLNAREAAGRQFAGVGNPIDIVTTAGHHEGCYPTLPRWLLARARASQQVVERDALRTYLQCLQGYAEPHRDRGWKVPKDGVI